MQDLAIFALASRKQEWLALRSSTLATNIANADTPGFKASDVAPFDATLQAVAVRMVQTDRNHIVPSGRQNSSIALVEHADEQQKHSGNTVSLESNLVGLGEVRAQHAMTSGIVGAFHRMLLQSVRG